MNRGDNDLRMSEVKDEELSRHLPMDLSIEMDEYVDVDYPEREYNNNLEQTIIIGEMDEGNIFDGLRIVTEDSKGAEQDSITISKEELKELIENIKLQQRADLDAIMLE